MTCLTCLRALGPHVPMCVTCLRALRAHVPYVPVCLRAFASYVSSFFYVPLFI